MCKKAPFSPIDTKILIIFIPIWDFAPTFVKLKKASVVQHTACAWVTSSPRQCYLRHKGVLNVKILNVCLCTDRYSKDH